MTTGGNSPGTLAEATKTSRNRALAPTPPFIAIDPKSHITGSPVLTSVVATSSSRPVATGMQQMFGATGCIDLSELIVPVGTQESVGSDQRAGADPGDYRKLGRKAERVRPTSAPAPKAP